MSFDESVFAYVDESKLAPFAVAPSQTRGRHYPEHGHTYRSPFERDRERIIHSTSFRRLQYKTQVFVNHEGDHYRTRMSHTLEVATVSRVVARVLRVEPDLSEAIALAHDLGHTPFGHTGEEVLSELTRDIGGFEHNRQSVRVIEYLERKSPEFPGLNLTYETREGVLKHSTRYDNPACDSLFNLVEANAPIEAQIVNIADELAYTAHDIDDGLNSKVLDWDELKKSVPLWGNICAENEKKYPTLERELMRYMCVRDFINFLVTDVITESLSRIEKVNLRSPDDVRRHKNPLVDFSSSTTDHMKYAADFLYQHMYRHYKVLRMSTKARLVVEKLFEAYMEEPRQLPPTSRAKLETDGRMQVVADYIAGMTDRYAMLEYKKLFDPYERLL